MAMEFVSIIVSISWNAGKKFIERYYQEKQNLLQQIILSEIREGDFSRVDENEKIAICYHLFHDAIEGVAKNNIRLMARLIYGLNQEKKLTVCSFRKYSKILADLSEEEINVLAIIIKNYKLTEDTLMSSCVDRALVEICGDFECCDKEKYKYCIETMAALERTGLLISNTTGVGICYRTASGYHSPFHITNLFKEIIRYIPKWEDIDLYEKNKKSS